MDVFGVFCLTIVYVGIIFFIIITEHKEYNKLIQEYNELVYDYNLFKDENTSLREELEKVKKENQYLLSIILKNHEN